MRRSSFIASAIFVLLLFTASRGVAQIATGSIAGTVSDNSNAILPGVTVTLAGEKLIGGAQTQVTDAAGQYRFDRLPPGMYRVKFELQGFRTVERADIVINATFTATLNEKLEVGRVEETITVTGDSPTIDTRSNLQQTVMNQAILEGVPSGRDPWSVAKIIPGVQVSTYDVGGTQSMQQSNMSAHGSSTNDVSYNIDGASVNWPGGGGGATMLYYDQGMFEEVNYLTSAIPAEVLVGGVSINMVTKDAGNKWRGETRYNIASGCLTPQNPAPGCLESDNVTPAIAAGKLPAGLLGNPTKTTYDFNVMGGGAVVQDRLWVNGSIRRWIVDKLVSAKNPDGTQALDDNTLKNYSGKAVFSATTNQKVTFSYNWNNKIRGHRRDGGFVATDIASLVQTNPASSTQAKYTGIRDKVVFESLFSVMKGQTNYLYQPDTPANAVRREDSTLNTADFAAQRHEEQPNSRTQFDNTVSMTKAGWGGEHLFKTGVQFARLYFDDRYDVQNAMYLNYNGGRPVSVREWNTPTESLNIDRVLGIFAQDSWSVGNRLTINLGVRFDHNTGILPAQSTNGGLFVGPQSFAESQPIGQNLGVWRTGAVYDATGDSKTALKASYSRYALQVGIDRVTNINPLSPTSRTCPWTDPNGDGIAQPSEIITAQCTAFPGQSVHYAGANGPRWPYSDEVTAGVERQVMKDMRVGVMYYYRTNRDQIGTSNTAVPASFYTPVTVAVPNGPNGATSATVYNLSSPSYLSLSNSVLDNQPYLDTNYQGVEFTANKRFSHRWQMIAGLTVGRNRGGINSTGGQSSTISSSSGGDLSDPNFTGYRNGIVGNDSPVAFRLSGSYELPGQVLFAGTLVSNGGYPYISTYNVTRSIVPSLVRTSQVILLSNRGDERIPAVTLLDLRFSRSFRFGPNRRLVPQIDIFNVGNASTVTTLNSAVGATYLRPTGDNAIVAPRIARIGVSVTF